MAVTLDAISLGRNSTGDITVAHTVSTGSNLILIAVSTVQDSNHANMPVVSIKWNGTDLTKVRHDEPAGNVRTEIWYLLNPAVGTFNLVKDTTGTLGESTLGAVSLFGANQVAPEANNGATGTSSSPSVSLTTVADNAWSITVAAAEATFSSVDNSQTVLTGYPLTDQSFENADAARREITPAGATTLGYTIASSQVWAISAVSVAPAAATTTSTTTTSTSSTTTSSSTSTTSTSSSTSRTTSTSTSTTVSATTSTSTTSTSSSTSVTISTTTSTSTTSTSSSTSITTSTTITIPYRFYVDTPIQGALV